MIDHQQRTQAVIQPCSASARAASSRAHQVAARRAQRVAAGRAGVDRTLPPPDRSADGIGEGRRRHLQAERVIHAGADPDSSPSAPTARAVVANEDTETLSVVDLASGTVAAVKVGEEPEGVTIRPDGKVVYVTCEGDGRSSPSTRD